jgi:hypothetical protein
LHCGILPIVLSNRGVKPGKSRSLQLYLWRYQAAPVAEIEGYGWYPFVLPLREQRELASGMNTK